MTHKAKLNFGTGGIPLSTEQRDTLSGIKRLEELGLNHMEFEFVYSVFLSPEKATEVAEYLKGKDFSLSVHGSYYTNLAAADRQKWHASISRLVAAGKRGDMAGARSITVHPAFMAGLPEQHLEDSVVEALETALADMPDTQIRIAPELTGKGSQYGSLEHLVKMLQRLKQTAIGPRISMCIDFAHLHARTNGDYASKDQMRRAFDYLLEGLGAEFFSDLHMHMSAIEFSEKGERNHLTFLGSMEEYRDAGIDLPQLEGEFAAQAAKNRLGGGKQDWRGLMELLAEYKVGGMLVCESPVLEADALLMKNYYASI